MMNKIFLILAFTVLAVSFLVTPKTASATGFNFNPKVTICHNGNTLEVSLNALPAHLLHGDKLGNCTEVEPTPTPTVSPTATPTESPEPTETPNPCIEVYSKSVEFENPCETPEATPSATPTPQPTIETTTPNTVADPRICIGANFVRLPANVHVVRTGAQADVRWFPTQGSEVSIFYWENENTSNAHGIKTENDGHEMINFLGNKNWTFDVLQWDGCAASGRVRVIDGAVSQLFRALPYVW